MSTANHLKTSNPSRRKHHKLLRDGSGTAVWPENVEEIFIQGLRNYWDSPLASYSGRGRSRWRNQFLVEYLSSMGVQRTKKQVASHIQVLRNMWEKGTEEYNLVAGPDELFQDGVKLEDQQSALLTMDDDEGGSSLSNSPPDQLTEFPPSPRDATSPAFPGLSYSPTSPLSSLPDIIDSPPHNLAHLAAPYPYIAQQKIPAVYSNRATTFTLVAEGMTSFIVSLDKLSPPAAPTARSPPLSLRLRLALPLADDPRAPVSLHGYFASVRLSQLWSGHARVITRAYDPSGACAELDSAQLHANRIELGTVSADFPDTILTRARWCNPTTQSMITQQVLVDEVTVLFIVYDLDRHAGHSMPSVEFVSFQKYAASVPAPAVQPTQPVFYYPQYSPSSTSSLSAALTPIS
ncbi:TEA domain-containing protein [Mycena chlorophos]|uniref:TEA domain-containing protein n=1 Tax=Mycena chlorophos TaxID=658473 RepID=A0A8H6TPU6_MYCCL|nr:TEA domain-containing protein [Mycena chlorophos]